MSRYHAPKMHDIIVQDETIKMIKRGRLHRGGDWERGFQPNASTAGASMASTARHNTACPPTPMNAIYPLSPEKHESYGMGEHYDGRVACV